MGNVASVKLKEDTKPLMITEKLVRDFQYHIKLVDHSMAAFARTTESLRKTFSKIRPSKEIGSNLNDGASCEESDKAADCMAILEKIDGMLSDQSFIVTDSLSRLLHFIIETGNTTNIAIPDHILLLIDKYRSDNFADVSEKDMQYHDVILESLRKKLVSANERYRSARGEINNLNDREEHYQAEKKILQDTIYSHGVRAAKMNEELEKIRNEENNLRKKNMDLKKEICTLESKLENMERNLRSELSSEKHAHLNHVKQLNQEMADLQKVLNEKNGQIEVFQQENSSKVFSLENENKKLIDESNTSLAEVEALKDLLQKVKESHATEREKTLNERHNDIYESHKMFISEEISSVTSKIEDVSNTMILINEHMLRMTGELNSASSTEIEDLKKSQKSLADKVENKRAKINSLKEKCLDHEQTIETLNKELHLAKDKNCELSSKWSSECETNVSMILEKSSKLEALQDEINKMRNESVDLTELHAKDKEELEKRTETEMTSLQKNVEDKNKIIQTLQGHITKLNDEIDKLRDESKERKDKADSIEMQLQKLAHKKIFVQVINLRGGYACYSVKQLLEKLRERFLPVDIDLRFIDCSRELFIKKDMPVLMVCLRNVSNKRGSDVTNAVKSMKEPNKNAALVLFHKREESVFQHEVKEAKHSHSELYGIFDIGSSENGLYECDANYTNIDKIFTFIKEVTEKCHRKEVESSV